MRTITVKKSTKKVGKKSLKEIRREIKNHNDRMRRANKKFAALAPEHKRVTIARDVLAQLHSGRLVATTGIWLSDPKVDSDEENAILSAKNAQKNSDVELQKVLKAKKECHGCALGGLFMCAVERANKLKVRDLFEFDLSNTNEDDPTDVGVDESDAFNYLGKFFESNQLSQIEAAFERGLGRRSDRVAEAFAPEEEDPTERMRLIMENVIVNGGVFVPTQRLAVSYKTPGFTG